VERGKTVDLRDLESRFPLYVSVEVRRIVTSLDNADEIADELRCFGVAAGRYFDGVFGRFLASLGDQLAPDQLAFSDARAYLLRPAQRAVTVPQFGGSGEGSLRFAHGWNELPFTDVQRTLENLSGSSTLSVGHERPGRGGQ
jgi:hypothetical protein